MTATRLGFGLFLAAAVTTVAAFANPDRSLTEGMRVGAPDVRSLGPMTFGPENILFVGDSEGAAIHAIRIEDGAAATGPIEMAGIDRRIAEVLGTPVDQLLIRDMAVHPVSRNVYITAMRGRGAGSVPVLLRVTRHTDRPIEIVELDNVMFSTAAIPNAPASDPSARRNPRTFTVTDLAFADGRVWVAGLSNEEFSSAFRQMPFPFGDGMTTTTLEFYHVSHGESETHAPVMTFTPKTIGGTLQILAAYTCTPLVAFPASDLKDGQHVVGRTVAELGAGNQPLDMITYTHGGSDHILIANSRHALMHVSPSDVVAANALVSPTKDEGITRTNVAEPGITQLADLDADHVVIIRSGENGLDLRSIAKSSLR
jgi:hypothetical protein